MDKSVVDPAKVPFFWRREIAVFKETISISLRDLQRLREATERKRVSVRYTGIEHVPKALTTVETDNCKSIRQ